MFDIKSSNFQYFVDNDFDLDTFYLGISVLSNDSGKKNNREFKIGNESICRECYNTSHCTTLYLKSYIMYVLFFESHHYHANDKTVKMSIISPLKKAAIYFIFMKS